MKLGPYSSHLQIVRLLGPGYGRSLLDIGCAGGVLGRALIDSGWIVTGIEPDASDAESARLKGLKIIENTIENALQILPDVYDVILIADVLEHLVTPETTLENFHRLLKPGGMVLASIPNVAHLAVRLQLMFGKFNYTERGPLDRTHLKFFTRRTILKMFAETGYNIAWIGHTPSPIELVAPKFGFHGVPTAVHEINRHFANLWPRGLGYQFLILATSMRINRGDF